MKKIFNWLVDKKVRTFSILCYVLFLFSFSINYTLLNFFTIDDITTVVVGWLSKTFIDGLLWAVFIYAIIALLTYAQDSGLERISPLFPIVLGLFSSLVVFIAS